MALPVTIYLLVLALISTRRSGEPASLGLTALTAALILAAAAAPPPILTLPVGIVIMAALVAMLLAYHLTAAHRASRQSGR